MMRSLCVACVFALLLSACGTPYQARGFRGGFTDTQLDKNTVRITFNGNAKTHPDTVQDYALYRSAEVTIEKGFDYFVIVDSNTDVQHGAITTAGSYQSTTNAQALSPGFATAQTSGTYTPGQTIPYRKFGSTLMIKMFSGSKPDNLPNAYDAKELKGYLESKIKRD